MTHRWTPNPAWYTARGWRVVGEQVGLDYRSFLVARVVVP